MSQEFFIKLQQWNSWTLDSPVRWKRDLTVWVWKSLHQETFHPINKECQFCEEILGCSKYFAMFMTVSGIHSETTWQQRNKEKIFYPVLPCLCERLTSIKMNFQLESNPIDKVSSYIFAMIIFWDILHTIYNSIIYILLCSFLKIWTGEYRIYSGTTCK